jgi:hypothetical protein
MIPRSSFKKRGIKSAMCQLARKMLAHAPDNFIFRDFTEITIPNLGASQKLLEWLHKHRPGTANHVVLWILAHTRSGLSAVYRGLQILRGFAWPLLLACGAATGAVGAAISFPYLSTTITTGEKRRNRQHTFEGYAALLRCLAAVPANLSPGKGKVIVVGFFPAISYIATLERPEGAVAVSAQSNFLRQATRRHGK